MCLDTRSVTGRASGRTSDNCPFDGGGPAWLVWEALGVPRMPPIVPLSVSEQ